MEIIILDDGINYSHYGLGREVECFEVTEDLCIAHRDCHYGSIDSHGTICAAIINKYAPNAKLTSVKAIGDNAQPGSKQKLLAALRWSLRRKAPLVHMSIGSTFSGDFEEMRAATLDLYQSGTIIVAAYDNKDIFTAPAGFSFVIGVKSSRSHGEGQISMDIEAHCILASGRHRLTDFQGNQITTQNSNSYAAPLVTALIHNILHNHGKLNNKEALIKLSEYCMDKPDFNRYWSSIHQPDFVGNHAVVFSHPSLRNNSRFFFRTDRMINRLAEMPSSVDDLVFIPESDGQYVDILESLMHKKTALRSVLYAGVPGTGKTNELMRGLDCIYWDETMRKRSEPCKSYNKDISEVPIVAVTGERDSVVAMTKGLRRIFEMDGYSAMVVGTVAKAYLYGMYPLLEEPIEQQLQYITAHYPSDIILLAHDGQVVDVEVYDIVIKVVHHKKPGCHLSGNQLCVSYQVIDDSMLARIREIIKRFLAPDNNADTAIDATCAKEFIINGNHA